MALWSRRKPSAGTETPEQTLARLQAGAPPSRFSLVRHGYDVGEVEAFLSTVEQKTAEEVRTVLFNSSSRRQQGYDEDEVDRHLDAIEAEKRRGRR